MAMLRRGGLLGILCVVLLGAADLHVHWDPQRSQDCAICQTVDPVRSPAGVAPSDIGAWTPAVADAFPSTPDSETGAVVRTRPRSRGPPS